MTGDEEIRDEAGANSSQSEDNLDNVDEALATARKHQKKKREKPAYDMLIDGMREPLCSFVAMIMFIGPDKRENRDKTNQFVLDILKNSGWNIRLYKRLIELTTLLAAHHERSTIRMLSMECFSLLYTAHLKHQGFENSDLQEFLPITSHLLLRCSDQQSSIRSRALDITSHLLTLLIELFQGEREIRMFPWLYRGLSEVDETSDSISEPNSTEPKLSSRSYATGDVPESHCILDWGAILKIFRVRVVDLKSLVRKSALNLLDAISHWCVKLESMNLVSKKLFLKIIPQQIIHMSVNDIALTVRQKASSVLAAIIGEVI